MMMFDLVIWIVAVAHKCVWIVSSERKWSNRIFIALHEYTPVMFQKPD